MIDFLKIRIKDDHLPERLLNDGKLNFVEEGGGRRSDSYRNLTFFIANSGVVEITGSIHKYFNEKGHNWNDFTKADLSEAILTLCDWLKIHPSQAQLHNVEFGVNINTPYPPKDLTSNLASFKKEIFSKMALTGNGSFHTADTSDYVIKCYDKGAQYQLGDNLFRFEVKVKVMRFLNVVDIKSLEDLQSAEKLENLGLLLIDSWDEVLLRECLPNNLLTASEKRVIETVCTSATYAKLDRKKRYKIRKAYLEIVDKYSTEELKGTNRRKDVKELLTKKWDVLLKGDVCDKLLAVNVGDVCEDVKPVEELIIRKNIKQSGEVCDTLPVVTKPEAFNKSWQTYEMDFYHTLPSTENSDVCDSLPTHIESQKKVRLHRSGKGSKRASDRSCKITNLSIENQRPDSIFISEISVSKLNGDINKLGLTGKKRSRKTNLPEPYYMAHNVRNKDSNKRNNLRNRIEKIDEGYCLFEDRGVRVTEEEFESLKFWDGTQWETSAKKNLQASRNESNAKEL
jgi:hypothetical protein